MVLIIWKSLGLRTRKQKVQMQLISEQIHIGTKYGWNFKTPDVKRFWAYELAPQNTNKRRSVPHRSVNNSNKKTSVSSWIQTSSIYV